MGYNVKIQRVERGNTKSFYVNFPAAVAEAANLEKGEEMEWFIEDRNTFVLKRIKPIKTTLKKINRTNNHLVENVKVLKLTRMPSGVICLQQKIY